MAEHESADSKQRVEFLWRAHSYVSDYVRFADTKAQLVVGWTTAILGAFIAGGFYQHHNPSYWHLAGFSLLVAAMICAVLAITPRLRTSQPKGFVFWDSILAYNDRQAFLHAVNGLQEADAAQQLAGHLFEISKVCRDKFWWVNLSIVLSFVGSLFCGVLYIFGL